MMAVDLSDVRAADLSFDNSGRLPVKVHVVRCDDRLQMSMNLTRIVTDEACETFIQMKIDILLYCKK